MASPFKTQETMDLARALMEEDSSSYTNCAGSRETTDNNNAEDGPKLRQNMNSANFDNFVITQVSSTELIPTQLVESSADTAKPNKPALMMVRDMNAGKGMIDDDGKPVVGKVFSRVIQIAGGGGENKPKQLKSHHYHRGRSSSSSRDRQAPDKEKSSSTSTRPQSSTTQGVSNSVGGGGSSSGSQNIAKNRQFSEETGGMDNNIVFCTGSSKDIM